MKYYKGVYTLRKPEKYIGNVDNVVFRSQWEKQTFMWCEDNPDVKQWNSEDVCVPYICGTDMRQHKYYIDLCVRFKNDRIVLVEVKPHNQTIPPKKKSRTTKKYLKEVMTYEKNLSKWKAATAFAKKRGISFEIWTERTLKAKGIKLLT